MTHYLLCDLKDDLRLIAEYESYHAPGNAWPEITDSIRAAGITDMQIFRAGNRLVMVMETDDSYSPERQAELNAANPRVREWEALMDTYQQRLPFAERGVKWVPAHRIFKL
ncbi:L-rhamnose mutarotase [Lewinella sp. JB7]|uniref:L-rhamnose mutarotase n=1 Tax=Lewinella sp. JB7 TaxID=2962887 RepID=UPI0020C96CED|nr:L-rhamnose mutarotase [Lewinella sp. JB7]MCP9235853.1 L-rhamnose mutarotase [Lewinella sp. JB7]